MRVGGPHCGLRAASTLGGEVYERAVLTRLPEHGIELELGLPLSRRLAPTELAKGWNVRTLPPGMRWWIAPLAFVPYTLWLLRRRKVDLLRGHSVLFTGPSLLIARRLARSCVPIVLHHHHFEGRWTALEAAVLRRADVVVTDGEESRRRLLELGVHASRISVVPCGVGAPAAGLPRGEVWATAGLRLLYLSRLIPRKRPELAIEALRVLLDRGVAASLVVAGDGPLRRGLERLASSLGVESHVSWAGRVSETEKWGLYGAADVLLFPSALEGFGLVVAEAQAAAIPVVVAEGTGSAEIVEDGVTGFVVPGTPDAFAAAAELLRDPELRRRMGERARAAAARFDWDETAGEIAEIYAQLVATVPVAAPSVRPA